MRNCKHCGREFELKGRKNYCSRKCMPSRQTPTVEATCPICQKIRLVKNWGVPPICKNCSSDKLSGEGNPRWRGGHRYWSPGRFGKDKDGLSWKTQRRLAWERDNYECQHCHEKKNRKPDVHHINPWMNSHSHALDNLISLCQKCHLIEESKTQEKWGGEFFNPSSFNTCLCGKRCRGQQCHICITKQRDRSRPTKSGKPRGGSIGRPKTKSIEKEQMRLAKKQERILLQKEKEQILFPLVVQFHQDGLSLAQIASKLPIKLHRQTMYNWLKWGSIHRPKKSVA